jgi:glyoxylase-like metal-dependent hydrolase (beta-lactamase superfamily II)
MSEPTTRAKSVEEILPGLFHWTLEDDRIHSRTHSYAISSEEGTVLIDPLPLEAAALTSLKNVKAICLTGRFHQRSAWRYQKQFGVPVYAPTGAKNLEGTQDHWYSDGDELPGGLTAVHAPGPTDVHYVFLYDHPRGQVLFLADLLSRRAENDYFTFVPRTYQDYPDQTRETVRFLMENYNIEILCPNHGFPVLHDGKAALKEALDNDDGR